MGGYKLQPRHCEFCGKKSMAPCETEKNAEKCSRNNNSKKALVNRKDDTRKKK